MKRIATLFLLAAGSVLLAGCVEDEPYYSTPYHATRTVTTTHTAPASSVGFQTGGGHTAPQPVSGPASTGFQADDDSAASTGFETGS